MSENRRLVLALGTSLVFFVVMSLAIHTGQSRPPECTKQFLDCRETLLCCDPTHACYEKTDMWAACLPNCTSGVHYDEEPQWRSPWTCKVLAEARRRTPLASSIEAMQ